ncbi:uncharacterized protein LOC126263518 [Schistocerca nitens]|uniref:uncharacterized protein LOC126263518 n=1 Tax=Schistocerca nitens TaxID=7011 RepID=UPI002117A84D|nr:uncharacterized protein LOC126263518 [Schistocerca nitens]
MSSEFINTEDFISEVESRPVIWDMKSDDYSNKVMKMKAWQEIITKFVPDFDEKSIDERNKIGTILQRKWKSLRASCTRELLRQQTETSGSAASGRKKYIYFNQLRLLTTDCKNTTSSIDNDDDEDRNEFDEGENLEQEAREKTAERRQKRPREKKSLEEEDILYNILKEKYARKDNSSQKADEDSLFMQSLVPELKKLPSHARLKVKSDLMNVIINAQQYYSASASSSSQIGFAPVPNYATGDPHHDRAYHGTVQGYTGGQSRLSSCVLASGLRVQ